MPSFEENATAGSRHDLSTKENSSIVAAFRSQRSIYLDCIRAIAILAVLAFHVAKRSDPAALDQIALVIRLFGMLGVDIFFPLSGFLITRFLLRTPWPGQIRAFFLRRVFRIVPLYLVAVTLYVVTSLALNYEREFIDRIWITYSLLTGWFIPFVDRDTVPYTITWSISVEEFAYLVFGVAAWLSRRNFTAILIMLAVFALVVRFQFCASDIHCGGAYFFPPARLDSIAIGGLTAVALGRRVPGLAIILAGLTTVTYLAALFAGGPIWATLKYTIIAFGTCFFIVLSERYSHQETTGRRLSGFATIGFYSYFIYLFHVFTIELLFRVGEKLFPGTDLPFWPMVVASLVGTLIPAVISFRIFEGPLMRYGRNLEK